MLNLLCAGMVETTEMLLSAGASVTLCDSEGKNTFGILGLPTRLLVSVLCTGLLQNYVAD